MEKMKHQDGVTPSAEDTAKLNEIVTWLVDHGFKGVLLVHKEDVGVSWVHEKDADAFRHLLINSLGHILEESEEAATAFLKGMVLAVKQIQE